MKRKIRGLKGRKNFIQLFKTEPVYEDYFTKIVVNDSDYGKHDLIELGIVCSKKAAPKSVVRNKIRRGIREAVRLVAKNSPFHYGKILIIVKHRPKIKVFQFFHETLKKVLCSPRSLPKY